MTQYEIVNVHIPPAIYEKDGKVYVEIVHQNKYYRSEVSSWFIDRVMEVYVLPRLKKME